MADLNDVKPRPMAGGVLYTVDATPKKFLLTSAAKSGYEKDQSLSELVDNSIDELRNHDGSFNPGSYVSIDIVLGSGQERYIRVEDNAGGVPAPKFHRLLSLGNGTKKSSYALGVFGVGGKKGMLTLGEQVTIFTRAHGEQGVCAVIDKEWIDSGDWEIELREAADVPEGHTIYVITHLRTSWSKEDVESLKKTFSVRYGRLLSKSKGNLKILINGKEISPVQDIEFISGELCPEPAFEPKETTQKLGSGDRAIVCTIKAGLTIKSSQQGLYGADVYCNDRLVSRHDKIGFVEGGKIGRPHASLARLRAEISLDGPGIYMPWNDAKNKLDQSNPLYKELEAVVEECYLPYKQLLSKSKYKRLTNVLAKRADELRSSGKVPADKIPKIRKSTVTDEVPEDDVHEDTPRRKKRKPQTPNIRGEILVGSQINLKLLKRVARKLGMEDASHASVVRRCVNWVDKHYNQ